MNRLQVRLVLTMMGVVVLSMVAMLITQRFTLNQMFKDKSEAHQLIKKHTTPPPLFGVWFPPPREKPVFSDRPLLPPYRPILPYGLGGPPLFQRPPPFHKLPSAYQPVPYKDQQAQDPKAKYKLDKPDEFGDSPMPLMEMRAWWREQRLPEMVTGLGATPLPPHMRQGERDTWRPERGHIERLRQHFDPEGIKQQEYITFVQNYRIAQVRGVTLGVLLALGASLILAAWLARGIAEPLSAVSRATEGIAKGDLSTRVALSHAKRQPLETQTLSHNFNHMAKTLEQLEGERKAMIADIAHELRTPLATMQLRLDALEDGIVPFDDQEAKLLKGQVSLLARLIDDLRTLSLADAGRLPLDKQPLELASWLQGLWRSWQAHADEKHIHLQVEGLDRVTEVVLQADRYRLTQVMNNLLDNAFKFTPSGGEIKVHAAQVEDMVQLKVADTGPGIPEAQLLTIFERFAKGQTRDTQSKGSGLGLAIVDALVTLHGGKVIARNAEAPWGAEVEVVLPILK